MRIIESLLKILEFLMIFTLFVGEKLCQVFFAPHVIVIFTVFSLVVISVIIDSFVISPCFHLNSLSILKCFVPYLFFIDNSVNTELLRSEV